MLKKIQIFKALDIEIKKQKGPVAIKDPYKGYFSVKEELSQPGISIIAETAGGNPLRGCVRDNYRAATHAKSLIENGAQIISVATDRFLFFGEDKHLSDVRASVKVPLLRHDFIFEEYQIEESKILGADGIFLMAYLLNDERLKALQTLARSKNLEVIIEVSNKTDLKRALDVGADIICVLGRDINTWKVNWDDGISLLEKIPKNKCLKIFEAGVNSLSQIQLLENMGVHGVIIGDVLLDEFYPGRKLAQILSGIETQKKVNKTKSKNNQSFNELDNDTKCNPILDGVRHIENFENSMTDTSALDEVNGPIIEKKVKQIPKVAVKTKKNSKQENTSNKVQNRAAKTTKKLPGVKKEKLSQKSLLTSKAVKSDVSKTNVVVKNQTKRKLTSKK